MKPIAKGVLEGFFVEKNRIVAAKRYKCCKYTKKLQHLQIFFLTAASDIEHQTEVEIEFFRTSNVVFKFGNNVNFISYTK